MGAMSRLVVATSNKDKIREIGELLDGVGVELISLDAWRGIAAPEETGGTFAENARQKARYYAAATGELVVAEDSGLEIDALGGAPGVESARYGGVNASYPEKFAIIFERLNAAGGGNRSARFVCALALARGADILFEARGTVEGEIAAAPSGANGFGYDPIFYYPPYSSTLGEASAAQKHAVSHRAQAFRALRTFLERSRF
jgi:XTP/dITP diphosphohydrolase